MSQPPDRTRPARARILDAAHRLMLTLGLARTTTKEIARAADCSEAALYKYFASKEDLFVEVLRERLPRLSPPEADGARSVEENLTDFARQATAFYAESFPIAASLHADPHLKARHYDAMRALGAGPHAPVYALDAYLRAEQRAGRIGSEADTFAAASLLLGACVHRSFAYEAMPRGEPPQSAEEFAARMATQLIRGTE
ncbi:TetR/AcrR family transcriptional regulator [Streptomyces sp. NPDC007088]|uniref:TetR/AcrR family transcriptional regulator n=1 Tax=Streptomyces sp. NPDC007088 TaxID=3364773 RepID=UPI00368E43BE